MYQTLALPIIALAPSAFAWGDLGHETVGYIAQNFVKSETKAWAQGILKDNSSSYLASVATWADSYKYTDAGEFSEPFHFIDAHDNPPDSCGVEYDRDCGDTGCVVSAIQNYTQRVQDTSLDSTETQDALKFLVHFLGDITQPLHDENLDVGGNDIDVTFDGESTNLHHIWDTNMLEKLVGGYELSDAEKWASELSSDIKTGKYADDKETWVKDISIKESVDNGMDWANDANQFVCSTCLKGGVSAVEDKDLSGDYYQAAIPVFSEQIAKGGYRLAAWLDLIATGSTDL